MMLLKNEIEMRKLPDLFTHNDGTPVTKETWEKRRAELKEILFREEYGFAPDAPAEVRVTETKPTNKNLCAGKVTGEYFNISFDTPKGEFSFPVCFFRPNFPIRVPGYAGGSSKPPVIIHLNFRPNVPDTYFPLEEITDTGFAAAQIYYEDVSSDNGDMTNGLSGCYPQLKDGETPATTDDKDGVRGAEAWGKLRQWAWAASRLMDVLEKRDDIDTTKVVVAGHSRLGKTAMLAAACDERFAGGISNDSGCSGAAITRDKTGERVKEINKNFPYWFCPNYKKYLEKEYEMPFDQHFLAALIAPRILCVGSAAEDWWADPAREFMSAVLASRVYPMLDGKEIPALDALYDDANCPLDRYPDVTGEAFSMADHRVHYHVRPGTHYFSREDWNQYLAFLKAKFYR